MTPFFVPFFAPREKREELYSFASSGNNAKESTDSRKFRKFS
ncbi:MAG: hypothetical protein ACFN1J_06110 [Bacteroidota bacterium]